MEYQHSLAFVLWHCLRAAVLPSIADLCQSLPVTSFETGADLISEGSAPGCLYVLIEGAVEILKGDVQVNVISDRGAIFGETSALLEIPHTATVRALTPCSVHAIEGGTAFLQSHKEIAYLLAKVLAHRLQGVTAYLADLKHQFEDHSSHLGMVDDILETLLHHQRHTFIPGSDRDSG